MRKLTLISLCGLALSLCAPTSAMDFFTIGSGSLTGSYYPSVGAICRLVNQYKSESQRHCSVEATDGSVFNLQQIHGGQLNFGIAQSDIIYQMHTGTGVYAGQAYPGLRSVMSLYPELLTLVVNRKSGIQVLNDIHNKRISLGSPGSGTAATVKLLLEEAGLHPSDLSEASYLKAQECPVALRDNKIDGYFYMVGHPNENIKEATLSVDANLIMLDGKPLYNLLEKYPYYTIEEIPADLYPRLDESITSIGVRAVLVTDEKTDDKTVTLLLKAVLENFETFKEYYPNHKNLKKADLLQDLTVPLHPAAERYYREQGLLEADQ